MRKVGSVQKYVGWGVGISSAAGVVQQITRTGSINAAQLFGSILAGMLIGYVVWLWQMNYRSK